MLAGAAYVDAAKLRDYCLHSGRERGKHKARVFASALGLSQADTEWLRVKLLQAAQKTDTIEAESDP